MNFNLMSPSDNGHEYSVRFRDPITIKPNSKVHLNFVEMTREGVIVFDSDQDFSISFLGGSLNCLPEKIPADSSEINKTFKSSTIKAGTYEYSELQAQLQTKLDAIIASIGTEFEGFEDRYQGVTASRDSTTNSIALGLALKPSVASSLTLNATHEHDAEEPAPAGYLYASLPDTGTYDNYALTNETLDFFRADDPNAEFDSYAFFETVQPSVSWTGGHFCGLYGIDYADGIGTPPTRTTGDNPPVLASGAPGCWVALDFGGLSSGQLSVLGAENAAGGLFTTWASQNDQISSYSVLDRIPIATAFDPTSPLQFAWAFSVVNNGGNNSIRWKIISDPQGTRTVIFDSQARRCNLPYKFLVGTDITYDNEIAIFSQIPFTFMLSTQNAGPDGWSDQCQLTEFDSGTNSNPGIILRSYKMIATPELASVLKLPQTETEYFPNAEPSLAVIARADIDLNWKGDNYSIFIDLPTNAYKNVRQQRDGGFKKSILSNVPAPFLTGVVNIHAGSDQQQVSTLYQPYTPVVYELNNNEIQTNSLDIKIVHMGDETPASEIQDSVVNLTIS